MNEEKYNPTPNMVESFNTAPNIFARRASRGGYVRVSVDVHPAIHHALLQAKLDYRKVSLTEIMHEALEDWLKAHNVNIVV